MSRRSSRGCIIAIYLHGVVKDQSLSAIINYSASLTVVDDTSLGQLEPERPAGQRFEL